MDQQQIQAMFEQIYADAEALGIGSPTFLFCAERQLHTSGMTVHEWDSTIFALRHMKEGLVPADSPVWTSGSFTFPLFKGNPPPGHPFPAAFFDAPAPPVISKKARKGKKLRRRRC
jgi:hypothetical protein